MKGADKGWLAIAGFVCVHNVVQAGRRQEMLSEAADRYMQSRPWLTRTIVALLALHIINAIPERCDPTHLLFSAGEKLPLILGKPNRRL